MNYKRHYDLLIDRARARVLEGYKELHHVLPRCIGGGDERANIVSLTAEEHYVAHQLLIKIHPRNKNLLFGMFMMSTRCTGSRAYGWLRRRFAASRVGIKFSEETIRRMTVAARNRGPEWRKKLSIVAANRRVSEETKKKISATMSIQRAGAGNSMYGRKLSAESKRKIALGQLGRVRRVITDAEIDAILSLRSVGTPLIAISRALKMDTATVSAELAKRLGPLPRGAAGAKALKAAREIARNP